MLISGFVYIGQHGATHIFVIFGHTELRIGASRAKNCEELDFGIRCCINLAKLDQKGVKRFPRLKESCRKIFFSLIFSRFSMFLLWSYANSDVTIRFLAIFCFRYTYYHLCTTLGASEHVPNTSGRRAKRFYKTKQGSF